MKSLYDQTKEIQDLVHQIETLRVQKQTMYRKYSHPENKRFSQAELRELVPSYKNLLIGRTQRLPSRAVIIAIANYLECNTDEKNTLLLAANYRPEKVELRDDEYKRALNRARMIAHTLPLPAEVISNRAYTEDMNQAYIRLNQSPTLAEMTDYTRHMIPWFFDAQLSCQSMYAPDTTTWHHNSEQIIGLFRYIHHAYLEEVWFQDVLSKFQKLPLLREAWNRTTRIAPNMHIKVWSDTVSAVIEEQIVVLPVSRAAFPLVLVSLPINDAARMAYNHMNIPFSSDWLELLHSGADGKI
ncbi:MAG: hypothetical protein AAFV98_05510 [Chloroflexota bacterium]